MEKSKNTSKGYVEHLSVFLSYGFHPKPPIPGRAEMITSVQRSCKMAQENLIRRGYEVEVHLRSQMERYGALLNPQIRESIEQADVVVADLSETRDNVVYEIGMAHGIPRHAILMRHTSCSDELFSDIDGSLFITYDDITEIEGELALRIAKELLNLLKREDRFPASMRQVWSFGKGMPTVINVFGPDTQQRANLPQGTAPSREFPDFARLEFIGDKDSLVAAALHVARLYDSPAINIYPSSRFSAQIFGRQPLIVIGGPLSSPSSKDHAGSEASGGNALTREFNENWKIPVTYSEDCKTLHFDGQDYQTVYEGQDLRVDYGVIARLPNLWNREGRALLFHGIHTYGVLGAVHALLNDADGRANAETIAQVCGDDPLFYTWCKITILGGEVTISRLKAENIRLFSPEQ